MLGSIWQDVRYCLRTMINNPHFALVTILTLALGIGANSAIFSVVNAILLRPLPFKDSDQLLLVWEKSKPRHIDELSVSAGDFLDWKNQNQSFAHLAAINPKNFTLITGGEPERISGAAVSASFFPLLGVAPMAGRTFVAEEEQAGNNQVAVLSYGFWQRRFGANANLVGQRLTLDDKSFTVVGIMPPGFDFFPKADLWVPLTFSPQEAANRDVQYLLVIARLKPGGRLKEAQAGMDTIASRIEQNYPATNTGIGVNLVTMSEQLAGNVQLALLILLGAVNFVLLIVCANVANLLLTRMLARQKEICIRLTVGVGRLRLIRQLLTESLLFALFGSVLGLVLAYFGLKLLTAFLPLEMPGFIQINIDARVLGFTLLVAVLTGIVFGLAPALQSWRINLNEFLKEGGRGVTAGGGRRLRGFLVISEMALALLLMIGAGLMIKSFYRLREVNPGFNPQNLLTMQVSLSESKYPEARQQAAFYRDVSGRIETLPGVQSVGVISTLPLSGDSLTASFQIEDQPPAAPGQEPLAHYRAVNFNYFHTMNIALLSGRYFTEQDSEQAVKVAIINESMANRFWPNKDALGKHLLLDVPPQKFSGEIVGIVSDVKHRGLDARSGSEVYVPYVQNPSRDMSLVVRTAPGNPANLTSSIRNSVMAVDKHQMLYNVKTMDQVINESVSGLRFSMFLLGVFAAIALVLAAVGIYGVMAYSVRQRTHEIGIRMALGAEPSSILKLVIRQGMILVAAGVCLGLVAAFLLMRVMASLLFGVSATDPTIFAAVTLLLALVALVACCLPARKATKVDPIIALRYE